MDPREVPWRHGLEHVALSHVGLRRSNNQDSMASVPAGSRQDWLRRGDLFMVADGMGAHAAGELASKMATDFVPHTYYKSPEESPVSAIKNAIEDANQRIHARGQSNPDFRGMGTTCSVLLLLPQGAVVGHVGDSRVYRLRGNRLDQLTFDHSLVWEMRASGRGRDGEVPSYIPKNIITRSLGPGEAVQVDLEGPFPLQVGDTFLLCSDGLSGQVDDEELGVILGAMPLEEAAQAFVDLANLRGGPDNITVILARVTGDEPAAVGGDAAGSVEISPKPLKRGAVHPVSWIILGVLALLTLVMVVTGWLPIAAVTGLATLLAATLVLVQWLGGSTAAGGLLDSAQLGRGPHQSCVCNASAALVEKLAKLSDQLRAAAQEERLQVDMPRFDGLASAAAQGATRHDYTSSVRGYCRAISFMMREMHKQRHKRNAGPTQQPVDP
jgi:PPM family protein phosphatase